MSQVATAAAQPARLTTARARRSRLHPLEALERGFALFQFTFAKQAWRYYLGAAPLVLCFIPIWVVDGQIRLSDGALLIEAVLLGTAYLVRVWMVGDYMRRVRESAFGVPASIPRGVQARTAATGRLLAWKIAMSAAVLATLVTFAGAPWFYAACEFASLEATEEAGERHSLRECLALASQCYGGSVVLFLMLFPLWIAVWLNGLTLALIVPQLLHSIFGVNTLLTTQMGVESLIRSSAFWISLFAGAWVALDPIVKCTFVVIYQHLRSRREGDDLRGLLALLPREQKKKAEMIASGAGLPSIRVGSFVVIAVILLGVSQIGTARGGQLAESQSLFEAPGDSVRQARVQRLRGALDDEAQRTIYNWHAAQHVSAPTWFEKLLTKIGHAIRRAWNSLLPLLAKLWPKGLTLSPGTGKHGGWQLKDLRLWIALIAALTLAAGAFLFWRRRNRRSVAELSIPAATMPLPDLSDAVLATERSEDEWFALASRLEGEGELNLAVRAAYLGLLSGLAQREWLTIRRDRTNREYLNEFIRRWRRRPQAAVEAGTEIPEKVRGSLRLFDRVWYGSHSLTPTMVTAYRQDLRELLSHV